MKRVSLFRRGRFAYLDWQENGRRRRLSIGILNNAEAERARAKKETELSSGPRILPSLPIVFEFMSFYLDWYRTEHPTTHSKARNEVKKFIARFEHRPIDSLRPVEMERYKTDRLTVDKAAPETVGKKVRRLQAAFRRGVKWKELDFNPLEEVTAPRGVRSVSVRLYSKEANAGALCCERSQGAPVAFHGPYRVASRGDGQVDASQRHRDEAADLKRTGWNRCWTHEVRQVAGGAAEPASSGSACRPARSASIGAQGHAE